MLNYLFRQVLNLCSVYAPTAQDRRKTIMQINYITQYKTCKRDIGELDPAEHSRQCRDNSRKPKEMPSCPDGCVNRKMPLTSKIYRQIRCADRYRTTMAQICIARIFTLDYIYTRTFFAELELILSNYVGFFPCLCRLHIDIAIPITITAPVIINMTDIGNWDA